MGLGVGWCCPATVSLIDAFHVLMVGFVCCSAQADQLARAPPAAQLQAWVQGHWQARQ
jgi:hypothetical protein